MMSIRDEIIYVDRNNEDMKIVFGGVPTLFFFIVKNRFFVEHIVWFLVPKEPV